MPTYNDIQDLLKKGLTIEAQEKIMELRIAALKLESDKLELEQRVKELEFALQLTGELKREGNVYFRTREGKTDGPYCLGCWDGDRKLVNIMTFAHGVIRCGRCGKP